MKTLFLELRVKLVLLMIFVLLLAACGGPRFSPGANSEYVALDADDVINILSAAGLADGKIVSSGREFRNYMASNGSATLKDGDTTIGMFTTKNGLIHISTMSRGSFIYNPETKKLLP